MSRRIIVSAFVAIVMMALSVPVQAGSANPSQSVSSGAQGLAYSGSTPLHFTENRGQWDERVLYKAEGAGGLTYFIERNGFTLLYSIPDLTAEPLENPYDSGLPNELNQNDSKIYPPKSVALKFKFIQSPASSTTNSFSQSPDIPSTSTSISSLDRLSWNNNYFLGNDQSKWAPNCGNFGGVKLNDVWKGIDVEWYESNGHAEFDFVINPGADPSLVGLKIEGLTGDIEVTGSGEELLLPTSLGTLRFTLPEAYQAGDGSKASPVPAHFSVTGANRLGLALPEGYDAGKKLIVDPLVYSTFIGGASNDIGYAIVSDGAGGVVVAGWTASNAYPTTVGALDRTLGGAGDAFISRLNSDGSQLLYSTYFGGGDQDTVYAIMQDGAGGVVVAGSTRSSDFPTTVSAYDRTFNGAAGDADAFVARINSDGSALVFSTYLGGGSPDIASAIGSDGNGGEFVAGTTQSNNFPVTHGAYDESFNGTPDVFVSRLSSDGQSLLYCTYLGGASVDAAYALTPDGAGGVIVTGYTQSNPFPTTVGAYDRSMNGVYDAFVTRFNSSLSALGYSTYLGGSLRDRANAITPDGTGGVCVAGWTMSNNFPVTGGAYDVSFSGTFDAFITRLTSDGSHLVYSTYLGGSGSEQANGITGNGTSKMIVTGYTSSNDFPTAGNPIDNSFNGSNDVFVARLSVDGHSLLYGTYLGGAASDVSFALASDEAGEVYLAGNTLSNTFPTTVGAYDRGFNGGGDVFVSRLGGFANQPPVLDHINDVTATEEHPVSITLQASDPDGDPLTYQMDNAPAGSSLTNNVFAWTPAHDAAGVYTPTFRVLDNGAPPLHDEQIVTISVLGELNIPAEYGSIQSAINVSADGDIILVAPGTYNENLTLTGHNVILASRYYYSSNQADITNTVLHGAGGNSVVTSGTDNATTMTGFTITGGTGRSGRYGGGIFLSHSQMNISHCVITGNSTQYGGGIYAATTDASTLQACSIISNSASSSGGGIYLTASNLTINSCDIHSNSAATQGGGIWMNNFNGTIDGASIENNDAPNGAGIYATTCSSASIANSQINSNSASATGGGISMTNSSLTMDNCGLQANTAVTLGGGIRISSGHPTILSCDIIGNSAAQGGGVNTITGDGTIFTNCTFSSNTSTTVGGGMTISSSDITIDGCVFDGNNGGIQGGGLRVYTCDPTITNSTFSGNTAQQGGGIYAAYAGAAQLTNDTLRNNIGTALGGGIQLTSSDLTMDGCILSGNASPQGAGMRLYISSPTLTHTAIVDNSAATGARYGGGFICASGSNPSFTQCTFSNNVARLGGLVWCYAGGNPTFNTCILYGDTPQEIYFQGAGAANGTSVAYCDLKGGQAGIKINGNGTVTWGAGNFDTDPAFTGGGDYHLVSGSPCIDTGDPDLANDPDATRADMEAYFFDQGPHRSPGLEAPKGSSATLDELSLGSGYPNPFNSFTTIQFSLKEDSKAHLAIYDLSGREVATLANGDLKAGSHSAVWNAEGFTSGIYLARLSTSNGYVATRKLTFLK